MSSDSRRRDRRLFWMAIMLSTCNGMVILDTSIANVSIPHIAGSLGVSASQATWTITSYAVADAITVVLAGWLALRFSAIRAFYGAMIGFILFSILCGMAVSLDMLVIARIGQGLCGGPVIPLTQVLILRHYPIERRAEGMAYYTTTTMLGPVLGPVLGGVISDGMSWHWIFFINVPIGLICLVGARMLLPKDDTPIRKVPIDKVGFMLMVVWIGALQIVFDLGREYDWFADPTILALTIIAVIGFIAFIIWELTEEHPVVDLRVFRNRSFTSGVFCFTIGYSAFYAGIVVIPQWLQLSLGYSATQAGYATCVTGLAGMAVSMIPPRLMRIMDIRIIMTGGIIWLGSATMLRTQWTSGSDFWSLFYPQIVMGLGVPFYFIAALSFAFSSVDPKDQASATGLFAFMRTIGFAFAASLSLTYWDNQDRIAGSELAGKLNTEATSATLAANGFSFEQARIIIAQLVQKEALTLATDKIFLVCGLATLLASALIWIVPRPKLPDHGHGGGAH